MIRSLTIASVLLAFAMSPACGVEPDPALEEHDEIVGEDQAESTTPVTGFAELHHHMMAEEAFGGGWFHGSHAGGLHDCDGGMPPSDHARVKQDLSGLLDMCPDNASVDLSGVPLLHQLFWVGGAAASEVIGQVEGTQGDTGLHLGRSRFGSEWPRWDTIAHQQAWEGWMRSAHDRGMNLVVVSAVGNDFLCSLLPDQNRSRPCDEMRDVEIQIQMVHDFVAQRSSWVEVALSPAHARQIIQAGKLAIVLSIEVSNLFGNKDALSELNRFHTMGVRTLQPVHQLDNRFGGAALHNPIFQIAQFTKNCHVDHDCGVTTDSVTLGFDVDSNCRNVRGLTTEGRTLIQAMMTKGMLIDLAHLSERGIQDAYALAQQNAYYPLYLSHGHFREIMAPKQAAHEKTTPAWVIQMLRRTGGMFGLRTAHEETRDYTRTPVANTCQGSSRSFAQAYEFGRMGLKVPMAFGADMNGFIQQVRPRFGPHGACSAGFQAEADAQAHAQKVSGPGRLGTDFDEKGLAHVGLLPDLIQDLDRLGANTGPLRSSAESFIRMWERASGPRSGMADPANDVDPSGVAAYVPVAQREASYPTQCGKAYAPASKDLGESCRFDAECTTGDCSSAPCTIQSGTCLCTADAQCGAGKYCGWGTNAGACQVKKGAGAACVYARECISNQCNLTWTGPRCK
ncbi:membrane dipeptidase [Chondromyces crocatus]|uniref:Peptidase M19 n=1 Tax=Chondromyces crocatus TaxID=52 RepID=A0A0K1EIX1_CHOCO|nr:membrane dipeptidase [Chondromyces crocatus]AKT40543.1 peptidase M19 [Chondromyces crocatus]